ncbi:MAG: type II toxin-antitoxin system HicA family toxin [Candidatus Omnitrophica bacterium]|nr:type II toxin-antitoxin system HicA family toxin [Candidatus Omnitrophota bacterium]
MPKLPILTAQKLVKALGRLGYKFDHQTGSHIILRNALPPYRRITVPDHTEIAKGTLLGIIHEIGMTKEDFIASLH